MAGEPITINAQARLRALNLIRTERAAQIDRHGYAEDHDDEHDDDSLIHAAIAYALHTAPLLLELGPFGEHELPAEQVYPWDADLGFRPIDNSQIENLIKAAALLVAEIERRIRQELRA